MSNSGQPIEPEHREKIFSPNFSTKSEGRGMGLALAKRCIQAIGGDIKLGSVDDAGTTFVLSFVPEETY